MVPFFSEGQAAFIVPSSGILSAGKDSIKVLFDTTTSNPAGWLSFHRTPLNTQSWALSVTNASGHITCSVSGANYLTFFSVTGAPNNGSGSAAVAIAPAAVMNEFWFSNNLPTTFSDAFNSAKPKATITGLKTDGTTYTVTMSASSPSGSLKMSTDYRVIGSTTYGPVTVDCNNNVGGSFVSTGTGNAARWTNVTPDVSGVLKVYFNSTDLNQDISDGGFISVVQN